MSKSKKCFVRTIYKRRNVKTFNTDKEKSIPNAICDIKYMISKHNVIPYDYFICHIDKKSHYFRPKHTKDSIYIMMLDGKLKYVTKKRFLDAVNKIIDENVESISYEDVYLKCIN